MKLTTFFILIGIILNISCQNTPPHNSNCSIDYEFQANFLNCILIVTSIRHGVPIAFDERRKSFNCLESLTNIKSSEIKDGDMPYLYINHRGAPDINVDYFKADLLKWKKWYQKNVCGFSMEKAENAFLQYERKNSVKVNWPKDFFSEGNDN